MDDCKIIIETKHGKFNEVNNTINAPMGEKVIKFDNSDSAVVLDDSMIAKAETGQ